MFTFLNILVLLSDCAPCHAEIVNSYAKTAMGRSFHATRASDPVTAQLFYHAPSKSYYSVERRDGQLIQRRTDAKGGNAFEMRVDYVMGSGNHALTYLHRTPAGKLVELPLGWYAEKGGYWAMNPGYDRPDHDDFRRPITYDCMFCHNAYPKIPAGHDKPFAEPVYNDKLPEGINCQRCHGDGAEHIAKGKPITKPGMDVCLGCHLETTSFPLPNAIQRYERGPFSYQPHEPLEKFILNFDHAPGTGREDKFEIVNAGYRMRQSACFLKSAGKMTCTTCHNPHRVQTVAEHNAKCQSCHQTGEHVTAKTDCVNCHMPKRRTEDVVHVVVTDHKIQRHKPAGDLLADLAEKQDHYQGPVVPYYPAKLTSELYLAVAQVKQGSNLKAGIAQLEAAIRKYAPQRGEWYVELAEAWERNKDMARALTWWREAARRMPASDYVQLRLGTALRANGKLAEAIVTLSKAPRRAAAWNELGLAYRDQNRTAEAIVAFEKSVSIEPQQYEAWNNLGILRLRESDFREAIRIKTNYADGHANLAQWLATAGRAEEAKAEFETALELAPQVATTHYNYALLLGRQRDYEGALVHLRQAVSADPGFKPARDLLERLLEGLNRPQP
jgi:tetratricopeptide (TPR) repeat protein